MPKKSENPKMFPSLNYKKKKLCIFHKILIHKFKIENNN
jgi:hypothetical protein